jgi:Na+:H+ antiporter, NhaA family
MTEPIERTDPSPSPEGLRPTWSRSSRPLPRTVVRPLQAFLETETSSAVLVLGATLVALAWANSPFSGSYERLWSTNLTVGLGGWIVSYDLRGWVSDGLMTLFFMVVGLELKRELLTGELHDRRAAFLPIIAAVAGMVVPTAIYLGLTAGSVAAEGYGIAMPTDVVFALAVLGLAGRAPSGLKAFLLTLAIVDDLGSLLVVAFADKGSVSMLPLVLALAALAAYLLLWRIGVRAVVVFVVVGIVAWAGLGKAGISPTLAGVALGLLTPAVAFQRPRAVSEEAHRVADQTVDDPQPPDADAAEWLYLGRLSREAVPPLARAEAFLLPWTGYLLVPLFALAVAGIDLSGSAIADTTAGRLALAILASRVIGKPLGIVLATLVATRLGAPVPSGVRVRHLVGLGFAAGIPFTVSLYIAEISLPAGLFETATAAILVAAILAGGLGLAVLWLAHRGSCSGT